MYRICFSLCQGICFYSRKRTHIVVILPTKVILNLEVHCATSMTGCKRKIWTRDWRLVSTSLTNLFFLLYFQTRCLSHWSKDFIMIFIANFYHWLLRSLKQTFLYQKLLNWFNFKEFRKNTAHHLQLARCCHLFTF